SCARSRTTAANRRARWRSRARSSPRSCGCRRAARPTRAGRCSASATRGALCSRATDWFDPSMTRAQLPEATISELDGVRYLHLGTPWVQGAMHLKQPRVIVLEYVQRMLAWMLWRPQEALADGEAVQLGLGAGAITRFTQQRLGLRT